MKAAKSAASVLEACTAHAYSYLRFHAGHDPGHVREQLDAYERLEGWSRLTGAPMPIDLEQIELRLAREPLEGLHRCPSCRP